MSEEVVDPIFLEINSTDFSSYVVRRSYNVQKAEEFATWVDGNWVTRHENVRTRVSGSFKMTFLSESEYETFLNAIDTVKTSGGYCPIKLWVNTSKQLETINAFITLSTKNVWTSDVFGNEPAVSGVTVKVTQR